MAARRGGVEVGVGSCDGVDVEVVSICIATGSRLHRGISRFTERPGFNALDADGRIGGDVHEGEDDGGLRDEEGRMVGEGGLQCRGATDAGGVTVGVDWAAGETEDWRTGPRGAETGAAEVGWLGDCCAGCGGRGAEWCFFGMWLARVAGLRRGGFGFERSGEPKRRATRPSDGRQCFGAEGAVGGVDGTDGGREEGREVDGRKRARAWRVTCSAAERVLVDEVGEVGDGRERRLRWMGRGEGPLWKKSRIVRWALRAWLRAGGGGGTGGVRRWADAVWGCGAGDVRCGW